MNHPASIYFWKRELRVYECVSDSITTVCITTILKKKRQMWLLEIHCKNGDNVLGITGIFYNLQFIGDVMLIF